MKPIDIKDEQFEQEVLKSDIPVFVDFWAEWCGPCKVISPTIAELSEDYDGKIKFVKINVDDNPKYAGQFGVQSIPNMKLFKNGAIVDEVVGAVPKDRIKAVLDKNLRVT